MTAGQHSDAAQRPAALAAEFERAGRILRAERARGCRDQVVVGGLAAYARAWAGRVAAAAPGTPAARLAAQVASGLATYGLLDERERAAALDRALASLGEAPSARTERTPARAGPASRPARSPAPTPAAAAHVPLAPRPARPAGPYPPATTPITSLPGVGPARAKLLERLGVRRVGDLLLHFPRDHQRFPPPRRAIELLFQREASFVGLLREIQATRTPRGLSRITATIEDETGAVQAVWFRAGYGTIRAQPGQRIALSGSIRSQSGGVVVFEDPEWELAIGDPVHTRRMVPVYPLTKGLTQTWLREQIKRAVDALADQVEDPLPAWVREAEGLVSLGQALKQLHFPDDEAALGAARRRLAFDELLVVQLVVQRRRRTWQATEGRALAVPPEAIEAVAQAFPFQLTSAQRRVLAEIVDDLARPVPMTRLLQGEVGSGKTAVAALALLVAVGAGAQGALMAPTELLAEQHLHSVAALYEAAAGPIRDWLGREPRIALLTGSSRKADRERALASAASGELDVLIGTHALVQEAVEFHDLGLAIVDEQHRFGVRQRLELRRKGRNPHLLVMTATPIPRSLALTLYGDLDLSRIDELPPGRRPVRTVLLRPDERPLAYEKIRREVAAGRQAFVICPLIEDSDALEARAATAEYERLQAGDLAGLRLGLLHGKLRSDQKERVMRAFRDGAIDVLVSTAVVEVGVDVPNATVMLIEGAERFGLAQLHQFRGRVGRGPHPAVCVLLAEAAEPEAIDRLRAVAESADGLALAERDLELRGPGDYFGVRQSGFPDLKVATLSDAPLVERARRRAIELLARDPALQLAEHQALARQVASFLERAGGPS